VIAGACCKPADLLARRSLDAECAVAGDCAVGWPAALGVRLHAAARGRDPAGLPVLPARLRRHSGATALTAGAPARHALLRRRSAPNRRPQPAPDPDASGPDVRAVRPFACRVPLSCAAVAARAGPVRPPGRASTRSHRSLTREVLTSSWLLQQFGSGSFARQKSRFTSAFGCAGSAWLRSTRYAATCPTLPRMTVGIRRNRGHEAAVVMAGGPL
jgi:hypothetical protein